MFTSGILARNGLIIYSSCGVALGYIMFESQLVHIHNFLLFSYKATSIGYTGPVISEGLWNWNQ